MKFFARFFSKKRYFLALLLEPPMLRLTDLRLPLDHPPQALPRAIAERLKINEAAIRQFKIFKRSNDVRKKNAPLFIYSVDVELAEADENAVLTRFANDPKIALTPDTRHPSDRSDLSDRSDGRTKGWVAGLPPTRPFPGGG